MYRSPLWALDCIAQETIRRLHTEALPALEAEDLLRGAVEAAAAIRPRLGWELEGRIEAWDLQVGAAAAAAGVGGGSWVLWIPQGAAASACRGCTRGSELEG